MLLQPRRGLRHRVRHVVMRGVGKHGDLLDERLTPSGVAVYKPITRLPLGRGGEHARYFSALWIDFDHAREVDLQALDHGRSVRLVLDEHRIDPAMRVPLPPDLGFGRRRVQVLVDDVENVSLATLDPDDDDGHVVGSGEILERAVDGNDLAVEGVGQLLVRLASPGINSAVVAHFRALDQIALKRRWSLLILACEDQPARPLLLDYF